MAAQLSCLNTPHDPESCLYSKTPRTYRNTAQLTDGHMTPGNGCRQHYTQHEYPDSLGGRSRHTAPNLGVRRPDDPNTQCTVPSVQGAGAAALAPASSGPVAVQPSPRVGTPVSNCLQRSLGCGRGPPPSGPPPGSAVGGLWGAVRAPHPPPPSDVWPSDGHAGGCDEDEWHAAPSTRSPRPAPAADTAQGKPQPSRWQEGWPSGSGPSAAWT